MTDLADNKPAMEETRSLLQPAIDALSAHIAVLDADGTIVAINERWRRFGDENGLRLAKHGLGLNYFDAVRNGGIDAEGGPDPRSIIEGIRGVLRGPQEEFRSVYPCHGETARRWFHMRVTPVFLDGVRRAVVAHENVTALVEATDALRESETRFRSIADTVPVFIFMVGPSGILEFINKPLRDYHGRPLEELIGPSVADPLHPDDRELGYNGFQEALKTRGPYAVEYRMRRADGEYRWFFCHALPRFSGSGAFLGYIGCCIDIHERKLTEHRLTQSEALNRAVLGSMKERIAVLDGQGKVIAVNTAWSLFASTCDRWQANVGVGADYLDALRNALTGGWDQAGDALAGVMSVLAGTQSLFEIEYHCCGLWMTLTCVPLRGAGPGAVVVHADVTERRQAQDLLQALNARLLRAQEDERRRLAREMHDDVTQRLAVLAIEAGRLELQLAGSAEAKAATVAKLHQMTEQLVKLSSDVHAISRQLHPSILDDLGLIEAIESERHAYTDREGIAVAFDAPKSLAGTVPNDVALCLYRIVQEGLRNVAEHAQTDRARIVLSLKGGDLILRVEDSGVGFDASTARASPGLGLASMRERARLIGAALTVDSSPGRGAAIVVRAPLRRNGARGEKPRVILADDHRIVSEGIRGLLEPEYEVVALVEDGRALLRAEELQPDVIVADVSMPLLNGLEAAEQLKRQGSTARVIFLTMHPDVSYAARALELGAVGFVLKTSAPAELLTAVREALSGRTFVTRRVAEELDRRRRDGGESTADPITRLTPRQREVLTLVAQGRSAKEVANVLNISPRTAEFHKYRLMEQLGVTTNAGLVQYAMRHGFVTPQ